MGGGGAVPSQLGPGAAGSLAGSLERNRIVEQLPCCLGERGDVPRGDLSLIHI